jgi:adenylate cyclase
MFVDIRGYTALVEQMAPTEVVARLNGFYDIATQAIFRHDGTLDKLVGDEVMAFFGAPLHWRDHPKRAVAAALEILQGVATLPETNRLDIGIGISTGEAFVGNVGGTEVTDYTVLGDTVNVAARLQSAAARGEILISQDTYSPITMGFPNARRRDLELKGKTELVTAWEIAAPISRGD